MTRPATQRLIASGIWFSAALGGACGHPPAPITLTSGIYESKPGQWEILDDQCNAYYAGDPSTDGLIWTVYAWPTTYYIENGEYGTIDGRNFHGTYRWVYGDPSICQEEFVVVSTGYMIDAHHVDLRQQIRLDVIAGNSSGLGCTFGYDASTGGLPPLPCQSDAHVFYTRTSDLPAGWMALFEGGNAGGN